MLIINNEDNIMKKVLFIDRSQLGLITDYLKYCEILHNRYQVHYLCFDMGNPKIDIPDVKVTYVPRIGNFAFRGMLFLAYSLLNILFFRGFIFIANFPKCSILKRVFFWKKMHIDVRTLSVEITEKARIFSNNQLKQDLKYFNSSSFITSGIQKQIMQENHKASFILPLGADIISNSNKSFEELNLLYVGTLNNRNIIDTVKGYIAFIKAHPEVKSHYDIVGDGINNEMEEMNKYIQLHNMEQYITLHGRIPYSSLMPFFENHNIGISYVPITDYYEFQPPTKTFEYILSGIFCVGTATASNKEIINDSNGILHQDNSDSFKDALENVLKNKEKYKSEIIRNTLIKYQWKYIIDDYLIPILEHK